MKLRYGITALVLVIVLFFSSGDAKANGPNGVLNPGFEVNGIPSLNYYAATTGFTANSCGALHPTCAQFLYNNTTGSQVGSSLGNTWWDFVSGDGAFLRYKVTAKALQNGGDCKVKGHYWGNSGDMGEYDIFQIPEVYDDEWYTYALTVAIPNGATSGVMLITCQTSPYSQLKARFDDLVMKQVDSQ